MQINYMGKKRACVCKGLYLSSLVTLNGICNQRHVLFLHPLLTDVSLILWNSTKNPCVWGSKVHPESPWRFGGNAQSEWSWAFHSSQTTIFFFIVFVFRHTVVSSGAIHSQRVKTTDCIKCFNIQRHNCCVQYNEYTILWSEKNLSSIVYKT